MTTSITLSAFIVGVIAIVLQGVKLLRSSPRHSVLTLLCGIANIITAFAAVGAMIDQARQSTNGPLVIGIGVGAAMTLIWGLQDLVPLIADGTLRSGRRATTRDDQ